MWKPDRNGEQPLYRQIAEHLERRISLGELPPGSALPSERKLAEQLGVNRSTVVQAYEELRASGIVESLAGSGTRVSRHLWGMDPQRTPNWHRYVEGGAFLPNLPYLRKIREAIRRGEPYVDFASGELAPELSPREAIQEAMTKHPFRESLGYGDPQGFGPLRIALSSFLLEYRGIAATDESILITSGSQQSLYWIAQCLLRPGDAIAIENPSYGYSLPMVQSAGIRLLGLPVDERGVRPESIEELYRRHRIRMVFLNPNYQNPTGTVMDRERKLEVLACCERLGVPIVEDDPFSLTAIDEEAPPPMKALDRNGTVLYVGSLSKIAASGLRIGWLIAPHAVIGRLADARQQMDFGLGVVPQWVAANFLDSGALTPHLQRLRASLRTRRDALVDALRSQSLDTLEFSVPGGGLHLWCAVRHPIDDDALLENGIKQGVVFVPGTVYGAEPGHVRLTYARPPLDEIPLGVAKFAEALRKTLAARK